jgi:succinyl-diaminopimelate desuccinylase
VWWEMRFSGVSAHGSMPHVGADANRALALAVQAAYQGIAKAGDDHELLGRATLVVGMLEGGFKTNVVSDRARAEVDIRYPPSLSSSDTRRISNAVSNRPGDRHRAIGHPAARAEDRSGRAVG